jgi:hypothetical protein
MPNGTSSELAAIHNISINKSLKEIKLAFGWN